MLREQPPLAGAAIAQCLEENYGLAVEAITFLPIGYDANAAVYQVNTTAGVSYFLKATRSPIVPANLAIPRALIDRGIPNVLAPLYTRRRALWCTIEPYSLVLYPFIQGENAMRQKMTDQQWVAFGKTLNAIHSSGLQAQFAGEVPVEDFATPMIGLIRTLQEEIRRRPFALPVQQELAAFWQEHTGVIERLAGRAKQLGAELQEESFDQVLCHGDAHAANIMLDQSGEIYLIDWDTPRIAPRERDLLFVVGSIVAHTVTPHEEACFFQGYGEFPIHKRALAYYRYERALEDIYEGGRSVFLDPLPSVAVRESDARFTMGLFEPGNLVSWAFAADEHL